MKQIGSPFDEARSLGLMTEFVGKMFAEFGGAAPGPGWTVENRKVNTLWWLGQILGRARSLRKAL